MAWAIELAEGIQCSACGEFKKRTPRQVAATIQAEPLEVLQIAGSDGIHPVTAIRCRGAVMLDEGSSKIVAIIHATAPDRGSTRNTDWKTAWHHFVKDWVLHYGRPQVLTRACQLQNAKLDSDVFIVFVLPYAILQPSPISGEILMQTTF